LKDVSSKSQKTTEAACHGLQDGEGDLKSQMRRASISVASNIAEGSERGSSRELRRFLLFAQASNAEVEAQAMIAGDLGCLTPPSADNWSIRAAVWVGCSGGSLSCWSGMGDDQ
jgi:four helix bundle protein